MASPAVEQERAVNYLLAEMQRVLKRIKELENKVEKLEKEKICQDQK